MVFVQKRGPKRQQSADDGRDILWSAITLRQIRYFVAVGETGQISGAASIVGISASAITEAINELETRVGVSLLARHQRGVKLTYEGYRFLGHCRQILDSVKDATYALTRPDTDVAGTISLATTITVAGYFLTPLLTRFQKVFPRVAVNVFEKPREVVEKGIINQRFNLGVFLVSNLGAVNKLTSFTLVRSRRRLWLPPRHRLLEREVITLADVEKEPYIQLTIDEAAKTTNSYWKPQANSPNVVFRTESVEAVRSLIASGHGVTILSDMVYRPWSLEGDRIEVRDVAASIPTMNIGIVWRSSTKPSPEAQAFVDFCRMEYPAGAAKFGHQDV